MPYLDVESKQRKDRGELPRTAGELNYALTTAIQYYLSVNGLTYQSINDIVGAFECAKAEFNRRVVVPYEDDCITRNGDVYREGWTQGRPNASL